MKSTIDMTSGQPLRLMMRFAVPILLSSVLQQLYTLADSMIVGRFLGMNAFAAVSAAGFIAWLPQNMMLGLTHGFGVVLSHLFGAGDPKGFKKAGWISAILTFGLALLFYFCLTAYLEPILDVLKLPEELKSDACEYLLWIYAGLVFFAMYNWVSSALRAAGDSRTPLIGLITASVINIFLDYVLIKVIPMGVSGPALSTVIGQAAAFLYCTAVLLSKKTDFPKKSSVRMDAGWKALLYMGIPPMLRDGVIAVGGLCVQRVINGFGTDFVGGMAAAGRYFAIISMSGGCLEGAVSTFSGQNFGAGQIERIRTGVRKTVRLSMLMAVCTMGVFWLAAPVLIRLITVTDGSGMFETGVYALRWSLAFLPFLHLLFIYRPAIQGMGSSITPMLSGGAELGMRIASVFGLTALIGYTSACVADGLGWMLASALLWIRYRMLIKKYGSEHSKNG